MSWREGLSGMEQYGWMVFYGIWCDMEQEGEMVLYKLEGGLVWYGMVQEESMVYGAGRMEDLSWNSREILCHMNLREAWCGMVWSRKEG